MARVKTNEARFLGRYDPRKYPPMAVTVDVALVSAESGRLHTLLVERREAPFRGQWALPGGFVRPDESLEATAKRVLRDEAGVHGVFLEQLYTFGAPHRDPRMRVVTVGYYALVDAARLARHVGGRTRMAQLVVPWAGETGGPVELVGDAGEAVVPAFDHADILGVVVKRMRGKLDYSPIGFQLLPDTFTLRDLQEAHETVLGSVLNKDSFRRRMLASGLLEATGERQEDVGHRPAELYRFVKKSAV
jgi:ADP-ribose pyrophosphatase YjhB (NUDIX family)